MDSSAGQDDFGFPAHASEEWRSGEGVKRGKTEERGHLIYLGLAKPNGLAQLHLPLPGCLQT
uniref:Uncharacterized protein n=1 Tax=Arundo donax TaxID=35708 RepID=A0A0A9HKT9_ARUDO